MADRIDDFLEGAVPREALTADQRATAARLERVIADTRALLAAREPGDIRASVLQQIRTGSLAPSPRSRERRITALWGRLWAPRHVSLALRPAYALLAVTAVASMLLVGVRPQPSGAAGGAGRILVQFRLEAPQATTVRLAGTFTNWQPTQDLHQAAPGLWTVTVPLPVGLHEYAFLVDGHEWRADPYAQHVQDGFGGTSSRLALVPAALGRL